MSDLSATNCGCGCERNERSNGCGFGNNSCIWIILLLFFCGGNNWGSGRSNGCDDSCIWIILLLFFCGGNSWGMGRSGCGCSDCHDDCY